jgi:hypothetical protein
MYDLKIAIEKAYNNQSENISAELLHVFKTKLPAKLISTTLLIKLINRVLRRVWTVLERKELPQ